MPGSKDYETNWQTRELNFMEILYWIYMWIKLVVILGSVKYNVYSGAFVGKSFHLFLV
jgi:hypothetical protein